MKKHSLVLALLLLLSVPFYVYSQTCPAASCSGCPSGTTWNLSWFGAIPNDGISDHDAFECAASCIQALGGNITLIIDPGVYNVGKQCPNSTWYLQGYDVFHLNNCTSVDIIGAVNPDGTPATILQFDYCLFFGSFTPGSLPPTRFLPSYPTGGDKGFANCKYAAWIGACFSFERCSGISVQNIATDGNLPNLAIGGYWGQAADGIQLGHDGFDILSSESILLQNVSATNFARDGVMIAAVSGNTNPMNIKIDGSAFNSNGRTGLAWVGGSDVTVSNSQFNHNAMTAVQSKMMAGIDIEWENGNAPVHDGIFTNVSCIGNKAFGLISNQYPRDFQFTGCNFVSSFDGTNTGWAADPQSAGMHFTQCLFAGSTCGGFSTFTPADGTIFDQCLFTDEFNGEYITPNGYMANFGANPFNLVFDGCTFESHCNTYMTRIDWNAFVNNCTFRSYQTTGWCGVIYADPTHYTGSNTFEYCVTGSYFSPSTMTFSSSTQLPSSSCHGCPNAHIDETPCQWELICSHSCPPYTRSTGTTCQSGTITMVTSGIDVPYVCNCSYQPRLLSAITKNSVYENVNIYVNNDQSKLIVSNITANDRMTLLDATGKIIGIYVSSGEHADLDLLNLNAGLYLLMVDGKGASKFIITK